MKMVASSKSSFCEIKANAELNPHIHPNTSTIAPNSTHVLLCITPAKKTWTKMLRTTTLATALRRHHHRSSTLLVKTANAWSARWLSSSSDSDSAASTAPSSAQESVLPTHIKFRMPDLDFEVSK